ncbi:hypothetical protein Misp01_66830 [Microtetraspora sp. NBRC 13810]|uniref:hypothetical protein n=1 Tax=Microtetraspora sp. NBRC 13810 TaxID=3030990 RepID=UPI0024A39033|nr:hypothetical protein [Microtetraspora sp. NBRC 13810]GLW11555.1 hypothetical protein Misp01_66830 [Microtetraspora sp. NBRC 13810]
MFIAKAVAATLLAGSFGGLTSPPSGDAAAHEKQTRLEVRRVACMTEKGLDYIASPEPRYTWQSGERERLAGDLEALRAYRAKYGFGVWAPNVYPKDSVVNPVQQENPNNKMLMSLSAGQLKKWRATDESCFSQAVKEVLGKTVTSQEDYSDQLEAAVRKSLSVLDRDTQLVQLGKQFAACLDVSRTEPTALDGLSHTKIVRQASDVAKKAWQGERPKGRTVIFRPNLKPAQARPYLDKEIKAALKDLECGKGFYAAYSPKAMEITSRVYQEFGREGAAQAIPSRIYRRFA